MTLDSSYEYTVNLHAGSCFSVIRISHPSRKLDPDWQMYAPIAALPMSNQLEYSAVVCADQWHAEEHCYLCAEQLVRELLKESTTMFACYLVFENQDGHLKCALL